MGRKKKRRANDRHGDAGIPSPSPKAGASDEDGPGLPPELFEGVGAVTVILNSLGKHRDKPAWRSPLLKPLRKSLWPIVQGLVRLYRERGGIAGKLERKRQKKRRLETTSSLQQETESVAAVNQMIAAMRGGGGGVAVRSNRGTEVALANMTSSAVFSKALRTLRAMDGSDLSYLLSKEVKSLRIAMHPFVEAFLDDESSSWTARASSALLDGRMDDAVVALKQIKKLGKPPKLGAVQRWVRDAMNDEDAAALESPQSIRTLDAIIRLQPVEWWWMAQDSPEAQTQAENNKATSPLPHITWHAPFSAKPRAHPVPDDPAEISFQSSHPPAQAEAYGGRFGTLSRERACAALAQQFPTPLYKILYEEKAEDRMPPNRYNLRIYSLPSHAIDFDHQADGGAKRVDVPNLPGAFVLLDVLTRGECDQIIAAAECSPDGYVPDESATSAPAPKGFAPRATNFVWLAESVADRLYSRCRALLPQRLGKDGQHEVRGINSRLRLYRYAPGAIYRPHVDGAWPGSGTKVGEDGKETYCYDCFHDRWSRLTFLVYLNEDFGGGCTTFYTAGQRPGHTEAHRVEPRAGSVLVFPHGGDSGSLVHEGSNVTRGAKYVIRTDVLYS